MTLEALALGSLLVVCIVLIRWVVTRSEQGMAGRRARFLMAVVLLLLPAILMARNFSYHVEVSKTTEFCLSCHVMEPYGRSLMADDAQMLPSAHFQNRRVPREQACYTCHTTYAWFGDLNAKWTGTKHMWVNWVTGPPDKLQLYEPFKNRECLHCHDGARSFVDNPMHVDLLEDLRNQGTSCLDCHSVAHDIDQLEQKTPWVPEAAR